MNGNPGLPKRQEGSAALGSGGLPWARTIRLHLSSGKSHADSYAGTPVTPSLIKATGVKTGSLM